MGSSIGSDILFEDIAVAVSIVGPKLYVYRYVRKILLPLGCTALLLRLTTCSESSQSLLQMLTQRYLSSPTRSARTNLLIGDICGLALLAFVGEIFDIARQLNTRAILDAFYSLIRDLPQVQRIVGRETARLQFDLERDLKGLARAIDSGSCLSRLPAEGRSHDSILDLMRNRSQLEDARWKAGQVSGAVYLGDEAHQRLLTAAFSEYSLANPLHSDLWPSIMKFEAEIVAMCAALVRGNNQHVCGCTTSGGTESIILAVKAHRDYYRQQHGITRPEAIACSSAHAALDKACELLGVRLVRVSMDPKKLTLDPVAVRNAIGPNTVLIYASAPSFPHGAIDPISELGSLASAYGVGLHVDCCLGGFVLPFARSLPAGPPIPPFDFTVMGVTSMSLDPHKYGYSLKGVSVVLYGSREIRQAQYMTYPDWSGGLYTTPTLAGSRSGGLIASAWASMVALGERGYSERVSAILGATAAIAAGVRAIPGLRLLGPADTIIVCFAIDTTSGRENGRVGSEQTAALGESAVYAVSDHMAKAGWSLNSLQHPACVHLCVTSRHVDPSVQSQFLVDLATALEEVRAKPELACHGSAAVYGMTAQLPAGPVSQLLKVYNDVVLDL